MPTNAELTDFVAFSNNAVLTTPLGTLNFAYVATLTLGAGAGRLDGGFTITGGTGRFFGYCGRGALTGVEAVRLHAATGTGTGQGEITLTGGR